MTQKSLSDELKGIFYYLSSVERGTNTAQEAFTALLQAYAGLDVHFPSNRVYKRPRIERLLLDGHPVSEISQRLGVSIRYVFYVREKMKKQ